MQRHEDMRLKPMPKGVRGMNRHPSLVFRGAHRSRLLNICRKPKAIFAFDFRGHLMKDIGIGPFIYMTALGMFENF